MDSEHAGGDEGSRDAQPAAGSARARLAGVVLGLLLAAAGLAGAGRSLARVERDPGIDFYTNWAIGTAKRVSPVALGTPYAEREAYSDVLRRHAELAGGPRMRFVNQIVRTLDPTPTPLYFAAFSFLPKRYGEAQATWRAIQWLAFAAALALAVPFARVPALAAAAVFAVAAFTYAPLVSDVMVGNVNTVQLAAVVVALGLAVAAERATRRRAAWAALLGAWCACLALAKPNFALLPAVLALGCALRLGRSARLACLGGGLAAGALAVLASSSYLGSARSWLDWAEYLRRTGDLASYPHWGGNYSVAALCAQELGFARGVPLAIALALLAGQLASVALGRGAPGVRAALARRGADALWLANAAIVLTLAASPLVWLHYGVLALLPILTLLGRPRAAPVGALLGLIAFLAYGGALSPLLELAGADGALAYTATFAWLPLWIALGLEARAARTASA